MKLPVDSFNSFIEHIGQKSPSLAKRIRQFFAELFGSKYVAFLERELLNARMEKERLNQQWAERTQALEKMLAERARGPMVAQPQTVPPGKQVPLPMTKWQQVVNDAIAKNAEAEATDQKAASAPKEN